MYRIKTNGKYILLVKDLDKIISHEFENGVELTDEEFSQSNDIKKLMRYLIVEKIGNAVKSEKIISPIQYNPQEIFVAHKEDTVNPSGIFIADPNSRQVENVLETKLEETIIEDNKEEEIVVKEELIIKEEILETKKEDLKKEVLETEIKKEILENNDVPKRGRKTKK